MPDEPVQDTKTDAAPEAPRAGDTTVIEPTWGPAAPDPDTVIVLSDLLAAEYSGRPATQGQADALARFQKWCRSHAIGGSNRKASDTYDDKVRDLVKTAHRDLLGVQDGSPLPSRELFAAMQQRGAVVAY